MTPSTTSRHRSREKEGSRSAVPDLRRQAAGGPSPTTTSGRISSPSWWREDLCEDFDRQDHHFERRDLSHHQHRQGKDPGQGRLQLLCHDNIRSGDHIFVTGKTIILNVEASDTINNIKAEGMVLMPTSPCWRFRSSLLSSLSTQLRRPARIRT